jgi:hypothetical protein
VRIRERRKHGQQAVAIDVVGFVFHVSIIPYT